MFGQADLAGILPRLTRWLLGSAALAATQGPNGTRLAVTAPAGSLTQRWLIDAVRQALAGAGLFGSQLIVEVTEDDLVTDGAAAEAAIRELPSLGARVLLSGFGAGALSLWELGGLQVDLVAVHPALVTASTEEHTERILRKIAGTAHERGVLVLADGVRDEHQRTLLRRTGCDGLRGPLFRGAAATTVLRP